MPSFDSKKKIVDFAFDNDEQRELVDKVINEMRSNNEMDDKLADGLLKALKEAQRKNRKLDLEKLSSDSTEYKKFVSQAKEMLRQSKLATEEAKKQEAHYKEMAGHIKDAVGGLKDIVNAAKQLVEPWLNADVAATSYAKQVGMSQEGMRNLRMETLSFIKDSQLAATYNVGFEKLLKMQGAYNAALGRTTSLTNENKESFAQMHAVIGEAAAVANAEKFEKFGLSVTDASEQVRRMFIDASNEGIVFETLSKNIQNNFDMVQNYTFANGIRGFEEMSKKATAVRLNMQQVASFADKVSTLEGAMTAGANLAVLGGTFAQFGNPLTMMYEGLNDMEALQDRMMNIFSGMGKWNSSKGMVEISAYNRQLIKAASEAMGVNANEMFTMIQSKGRGDAIEASLNGTYSREDIDFLRNIATLDKSGNAFVSIGGEKRYLKDGKLTADEMRQLRVAGVNSEESLKNIAVSVLSIKERGEGLKTQMQDEMSFWAEKINVKKVFDTILSYGDIIVKIMLAGQVLKAGVAIGGGIKQTVSSAGKLFGKGGLSSAASGISKLAKGASVAGGLIAGVAQGFEEFGAENRRTTARKVGRTAGAAIGTAVGSWIGSLIPGAGTVIGGFLGNEVGRFIGGGFRSYRRIDRKFKEFGLEELKGDYNVKQLKKINEYLTNQNAVLDSKTEKLIRKFGDWESVQRLREERLNTQNMEVNAGNVSIVSNNPVRRRSTGGWVTGPGTETSDSIPTFLSNGEYVINARSAKENAELISAINDAEGPLQPIKNNLNTIRVLPNSNVSANSVSFSEPLTLNIGGVIRLELGDIAKINIKPEQILTPSVVSQLTREIQTQIERGFNKETYRGFKFSV